MKNYINKHPSLILNHDINTICNPLKKLNIDYFAHVLVTPQNHFSAIATSAGFTEHYLKKKYYNIDVHVEDMNFTQYLIVDMFDLKGVTAQLQSEAAMFGVKHVFTIIEQDSEGRHYYHFGNSGNSFAINQNYLSNLDLLKAFIPYFKSQINSSKELKIAHELKFQIQTNTANCQKFSAIQELATEDRLEYIKLIGEPSKENLVLLNKASNLPVKLTVQQSKCVNLLASGNTNKQIAKKLGLSIRTIQHYLDRVRYISGCRSSKELIALFHSLS